MSKSVWVGMSGGVDSSVAALLLQKEGYNVEGITLLLTGGEDSAGDAREVCAGLGIPHHTLELTGMFEQEIMRPFADAYMKGLTPNPCVLCNRVIKFGAMLEYALSRGADALATGHYAKIVYNSKDDRYVLHDTGSPKDQSYFLYGLSQFQLSHAIFPLCGMEKADVREIAAAHKLPVALKSDSMDVCFISGSDAQRGAHVKFIENLTGTPLPVGNFTDMDGNVLGQHNGIARYTIGQRKGLGLSAGNPVYVVAIDPDSNTVMLGHEGDQDSSTMVIRDINYIAWQGAPDTPAEVTVRIRYRTKPVPAVFKPLPDGNAVLEFSRPVRAAAPGQSAVFYDGSAIAGGGIIKRSYKTFT